MKSSNENKLLNSNEAWNEIFIEHDIINYLQKHDLFTIKASQIKKYREPRLMAKWDNSKSLPDIFKNNHLNILPVSRNEYVIGDFLLYHNIPELEENIIQMSSVQFSKYESIDINDINSEANAINVLLLSGILDDFLETPNNKSTFNGRMGTRSFSFFVDSYQPKKQRQIHVQKAQCEIDGGFENEDSIIIMEAKNIVFEDFHVRQLYYPYRLWKTKVNKPIRLVFSMYSNKIFRLFEYEFSDLHNYSSIKLVKEKNYSLQDTTITMDDLLYARKNTRILYDDNQIKTKIPFIQADSMSRIISLMENLSKNPMTEKDIASLMDFELRQARYYYNAGNYLGLFEKHKENTQILIRLSKLGDQVYDMNYKKRQLKIVGLILEHKIFAELFDYVIENGTFPEKRMVITKMKKYNVCSNNLVVRRSSSILAWLRWIFTLTRL